MAIVIQCGACRKRYTVNDAVAGRKVKCKNCGAAVQVGAAGEVSGIEGLEIMDDADAPPGTGPGAGLGAGTPGYRVAGATPPSPKPAPAQPRATPPSSPPPQSAYADLLAGSIESPLEPAGAEGGGDGRKLAIMLGIAIAAVLVLGMGIGAVIYLVQKSRPAPPPIALDAPAAPPGAAAPRSRMPELVPAPADNHPAIPAPPANANPAPAPMPALQPPAPVAEPPKEVADIPAPTVWDVKADATTRPFKLAPTSIIRQNFTERVAKNIVFPSLSSPYVAIGANDRDADERWIVNLSTGSKVLGMTGNIAMDRARELSALAPDGSAFAAPLKSWAPVEIAVWHFKDKKQYTLHVSEKDKLQWLDFAGPRQVIVRLGETRVIGNLNDPPRLEVWDFDRGQRVWSVPRVTGQRDAAALSGGGRYVAAFFTKDGGDQMPLLRILSLATGAVVGEVAVPKATAAHTERDPAALSFSPDGTQLVGLFGGFKRGGRIVVWDLDSGLASLDHVMAVDQDPDLASDRYQGLPLEWLEDNRGWLAYGRGIVGRQTGELVLKLPPVAGEEPQMARKLVDDKHLIVTSMFRGARGELPILQSTPLPLDRLDLAVKTAQSGGTLDDSQLPPLTRATLVPPREMPDPGFDWTAKPDPAPPAGKTLLAKPIVLNTDEPTAVYAFFTSPAVGQVMMFKRDPRNFAGRGVDAGANAGVTQVGVWDLSSGAVVNRMDVPAQLAPVDLSPDGKRSLHLFTARETRLDVLDLTVKISKPDDALKRHVVGWRPYDADPRGDTEESRRARVFGTEDADKRVAWARFTDSNHVLAKMSSGRLTLWQLPECKAVWSVSNLGGDVSAYLSPNRRYLLVMSGAVLALLDTTSGQPAGRLEPPGVAAANERMGRIAGALFSADGQRLTVSLSGERQHRLIMWGLADGRIIRETPAAAGGSVYYAGADSTLVDQYLIDVKTGQPLWRVEGGHRLQGRVDDRLCYIADVKLGGTIALVATDIPDKATLTKMKDAASHIPAPLLAPGGKVSADTTGVPADYQAQAAAAIQNAATDNHWTLADGQPLKLVVSMTAGTTGRQMTYFKSGGPIVLLPGDNRQPDATVPIEQVIVSYKLVDAAGPVLWEQTQTAVMSMPGGVNLDKIGEITEAARKQMWASAAAMLTPRGLPATIFPAADKSVQGTTRLTGAGPVVDTNAPVAPPVQPGNNAVRGP